MRKRNIRIWARVTEAENEIISKQIKKTGLSREAYIRCLLLGTVPKEKPDEQFYAAMQELSAINNSIKTLVRMAACTNTIDASLLEREAENWRSFRMEVKRRFLEPDKLVMPDGRD